jgi:hypothetical protein
LAKTINNEPLFNFGMSVYHTILEFLHFTDFHQILIDFKIGTRLHS